VRRHVDLLLENHALLTTQIQALDRHIKDTVKRDATAQRLQTIPGIGPFGALLLQAEIGRSVGLARPRSWPPMGGSCRARGVPGGRPTTAPSGAGTLGSSGS
jgi:hypothetical protein